jgi:monoamine oxidase
MDHFDVIIVGGGCMGLAAAYSASKIGKKALLLERNAFFNDQGSSAGLSRMWRVIYSERYLAELALHTDPLWRELESECRKPLIDRTGILWFGQAKTPTTEGQIEEAMKTMDSLGLPYEKLSVHDIEGQYGFANLPPDYIGVFQDNAGTIRARDVLETFHRLASAQGASLVDKTKVTGINVRDSSIIVKAQHSDSPSDDLTFGADKLILCPGPYVNETLGLFGVQLDVEVWEMASAYFKLLDSDHNYPVWFQFQEKVADDPGLYYGFPASDWEKPGHARVAPDFASRIIRSPEYRSRAADVEDLRRTSIYVQRAMPHLEARPVDISSCLITMTRDQNPVLDFLPEFVPLYNRIVLYVGGWGYKFAPLIGQICIDLAFSGRTPEDISNFKIDRTGVLTGGSGYRSVIQKGLGRAASRKRIAIAGAGMAGLVSGSLLKEAGHEVVIIEASDRIGGRIRTLREEFDNGEDAEYQYAEAGAMRIPQFHVLVQDYIRKFGLKTNPFFETDHKKRSYIHANGVRVRLGEYERNPDLLGYAVGHTEVGRAADQLLDAVIQPIVRFVSADQLANWPVVLDRFDRYSVRGFLKEQTLYSEAAIEMIEVLLDEEELMSTPFIESIRDRTDINANNTYVEIEGGMDNLPKAFGPLLKGDIQLNKRISKITQDRDGGVTLWAGRECFEADRAIITMPFSALRHVETMPLFSPGKRKAIRELHYDSSTKILLQFKRRFWEQDDDIFGGGSVTDLPIRFVYYPSHGLGRTGPAVLLASYTWSDDSQRWDSLSPQERIDYALEGLAKIHGEVVRREFIKGTSYSWMQDHCNMGAFALFNPGQQAEFWPFIASPEGKVHFAGEHTTLKHAWIEGAIESGVRAAIEVAKAIEGPARQKIAGPHEDDSTISFLPSEEPTLGDAILSGALLEHRRAARFRGRLRQVRRLKQ